MYPLTLDGLDRAMRELVAVAQRATCLFTLRWRGGSACRAQRRQAGWGSSLALTRDHPTPAHIIATLDVSQTLPLQGPPGEGEAWRVGRSN